MRFGTTGIIIAGIEIITYYGLILTFGAIMGAWLASREARRRGQNPELVWDGLIWVLIGGIIGARLWHILTPPPSFQEQGITTGYYLTHPLELINTRRGGLGIPGAIIGGVLALRWFTGRAKLSFLLWADMAAPGLALGQAIGRWGNYINQELYGFQTNLPWGIRINGLPGKYHPLFLYESLWNLANMILLLWLGRRFGKKLLNGDLLLIYLVVYPVGRFLLEFLRVDPSLIAGLNINQTVALVVALAAGGMLFWRHKKKAATA